MAGPGRSDRGVATSETDEAAPAVIDPAYCSAWPMRSPFRVPHHRSVNTTPIRIRSPSTSGGGFSPPRFESSTIRTPDCTSGAQCDGHRKHRCAAQAATRRPAAPMPSGPGSAPPPRASPSPADTRPAAGWPRQRRRLHLQQVRVPRSAIATREPPAAPRARARQRCRGGAIAGAPRVPAPTPPRSPSPPARCSFTWATYGTAAA